MTEPGGGCARAVVDDDLPQIVALHERTKLRDAYKELTP